MFEPEGEKEHEAEYKKIHEDYKNLVHTHILLFLILDASVFMFFDIQKSNDIFNKIPERNISDKRGLIKHEKGITTFPVHFKTF